MSETPFIKFFPSDFLGGTGGLSPAERGVYITILCLIWENDGPINLDDTRLARRCGMPKAAFTKALASLFDEGKLYRGETGITNKRAEKTLMDRQNRTQNASIAANSRWTAQREKAQENQHSPDAPAMPGQCVADAKPEARSQSIDDTDVSSCSPPPNFDAFWSAWPLSKIGKEKARSAYSRLSAQNRIEATESAATWAEAWRQANPTLSDIHPTTYLNGKRWNDEFPRRLQTINGGQYDQSRPHPDRRQQAANEAFANRIALVARARPPSGGDWFDG